jgi:ABC-type Fe3+ transport system substrate-binding protein
VQFVEGGDALHYVTPEQPYFADWSYVEGQYYTIANDPMVTIYNPTYLPEDKWPRGLEHLASMVEEDPEWWDGKICSYDPRASGTGFNNYWSFIGKYGDEGWGWLESIYKANVALYESSGPQRDKVLAAEHLVSIFHSAGNAKRVSLEEPELLAWLYDEEGPTMNQRSILIPKESSSPNSAKLLLDYCLSYEGQAGWGSRAAGRHPGRLDMKPGETAFGSLGEVMNELGEDLVMPWSYLDRDLQDSDLRAAFLARYEEVIPAR